MSAVPCIDLGEYQRGFASESQRQQQLSALAKACEDHGFFLMKGHGADALIAEVFVAAQSFFNQPREHKLSVMRDAENPLGYYDREFTKQFRDQKEVFDFKAGGHQSSNPARQSRWPLELPDFQATLTRFFSEFTSLSEQTMAMVFDALGMPDQAIEQTMRDGFGEAHSSAARLNLYPADDPLPTEDRDGVNALGDMALHHHTDPGAITLLLQDDHGGLQARSKLLGWIDVTPEPGTIVVNVGDVLQVWTNDRCTAGVHRVLPVHSAQGRYSVPFFYQPRYDAQISPWTEEGENAHFETFSWRDFIRGRVSDNFADYGGDDIQIDRYRVA